jgi:hypothetical protein
MSDSPVRLSLSANGLQRLETIDHAKDFTFIVGGRRYLCPSFVAEFVSPRVSSLRSVDITIDELSLETQDPDHQFGLVLSIGFGREVVLSEREIRFVRSVCGELWNSELFELTFSHEKGKSQGEDLKAGLSLLSGDGDNFEWKIPIIASHFHEFSVSDFDHINRRFLEGILNDSKLVLQDEDSLFEIIHQLASEDFSYFGLLEYIRFEFVSPECMKRAFEFISNSFDSITFGIWTSLEHRLTLPVTPTRPPTRFRFPAIDSKIISTIPTIFSAFEGKTFRLLYRGSHDGFGADDFHQQCNGHRNTVTLILSTNDCIFGGYSPIAWSSRECCAPDLSMASFLFTIKNPRNLPAQIFKQKQAEKAILDYAASGPAFGSHSDLYVSTQCQTSNRSYSDLGTAYANDTGIAGTEILTGSRHFTVQEIEVFELI